jgi:lipopolysaccharide biosynthesis protein
MQQEASPGEALQMQEQVRQLSQQVQNLVHRVESQSQNAAKDAEEMRSLLQLSERIKALEELVHSQVAFQEMQTSADEEAIAAVHEHDRLSTGAAQAKGGATHLDFTEKEHVMHQRLDLLARQVDTMSIVMDEQADDIQRFAGQLETLVQGQPKHNNVPTEVASMSARLEEQSKRILELVAELEDKVGVRQHHLFS